MKSQIALHTFASHTGLALRPKLAKECNLAITFFNLQRLTT